MQHINYTFKRYEIKYHIPADILPDFRKQMEEHMTPDEYGKTTILNLYYDTAEHDLISRSMEKPKYKEKLRLRSYGVPTPDSRVFVELKKKYAGVVYKRRSSMSLRQAQSFLDAGTYPGDPSQINREISYFVQFYRPKPAMVLCYDREAFLEKNTEKGSEKDLQRDKGQLPESSKNGPETGSEKGSDLRMTLDSRIRCREQDLNLEAGDDGLVLEPDTVLLEIKAAGAMPLWLTHLLSQYHIYPSSFSKYGFAYSQLHHKSCPKDCRENCKENYREDFHVYEFA